MSLTMRTVGLAAALYASFSSAQRALVSDSFSTCGEDSQLTATTFDVAITPDNRTIAYSLFGTSTYSGNATIDFVISVDSIRRFKSTIDPCLSTQSAGFCPASAGQLALVSDQTVPQDGFNDIPDDVYTESDPKAYFQFILNNPATNETVGCLQATLRNDAAGNTSTSTGNTTSSNTTSSDDNGSGSANETSSSNSTGGSGGDSGASTSYMSWTLLLSAIFAMALFNGL
ncbi:hypothetical protein M409DRAFT_17865 [Zasmidium cellare ATCC 36951]|uniref:ML-like domain-containing protein n=1 Tax=Zasmidium cellare ATCC 36951 TaxID=1080233 RepID=A0A6A6D0M7_ZASCE|nr:uncharacterized protein M409DRAFT_17865 [Zasmidium cellare ATCC 36951]KAF2171629.1 hypothetical protein M409DRAFT_17865 [Zasmidium cellare ATCC 36951]